MTGRSTTPWIHQQSRLVISVLAALGMIETGYLTWIKWSGGSVACPTHGCNDVLNSSYATILGFPLPLFGCLAYGTLLTLAITPMVLQPKDRTQKRQSAPLDQWTWRLMFALATGMVICSSYLMYLLFFQIQAFCPYCIASALCSATLFILTIVGYPWEDLGQLGFNGLIMGMVTLVTLLGLYSGVNAAAVDSATGTDYQITTASGSAEIELARHLHQVGAKMYGAYWCPHCQEQKELFGEPAFAIINYIECDPNGKSPQAQRCKADGITGYPTWEIQGQFYPGRFSLEKLADLSGYSRRRKFENQGS